jgi:hypothetical protein
MSAVCASTLQPNPPSLSLYETTIDQVPEMPLSRKETHIPLSLSPLSLSLTKEENSSHTQFSVQRLIWGLLGFFHSASDFLPLPLSLSLSLSIQAFVFLASLLLFLPIPSFDLLFIFYLRGDEEGKEIAVGGGISIHIFVSGRRRRQN